MSHTPGPWHLCQHLKGLEEDSACSCGYRGVIFGPDEDVAMAICQPGHERPKREEEWGSEPARYPRAVELANARLIAASPALLDVLEEIISNSYVGKSGQLVVTRSKWANYPAHLYHKARAAVALAKGEQTNG